jgi:transposase InsO family protein
VRPKKTRPYTPRTNGKAERFIQTSIKEWAYSKAYDSSAEREEYLNPWLNFYNNQRPHSALKRKSPVSRLKKCEQPI